jgi:F420-dependent oxidoreductase-like protein
MLVDRAGEVAVVGVQQAGFELADQDAQLAPRRAPRPVAGVREAVPRASERQQACPSAAAVGGEHRTDAAVAIGVRADDHALCVAHAFEHRYARGDRQAVDRQAQVLDVAAAGATANCHRVLPAGVLVWPAAGARPSVGRASQQRNRTLPLKGNLHMKLGVHIGYWGLGLSSDDQLTIVTEAERLGYDSVWAAEAYGSDTATVLGWLAGQTSKIRLGAGIFQMPGRSPAMTAMTAATIDQLSNGRMIIGIGSSGPQVAEGWHGQRFAKQLQRTREYVAVVRMALARERVEFHGETLELPLPDGPGKALKLTISPVQERIPIYLAAIGPKNTALAGEIADGWIPTLFSPEHVSELRPLLEEGAARSGKSLDDFDIAPTVSLCIDDDLEAARNTMRPFVALYVGGMGSRKQNFYNQLVQRYGYEAEAKTIQDLYLEGKRDEAMAAIPDALIDSVSLCGPKDVVRERLAVYRDAGVGTLGVTPTAFTAPERLEQLRLLAELAA